MKHEKEGKIPFSEKKKIDRLITHKILGLPIFLAVIIFLFFRLRLRGLEHLYRIC